MDPNQSSPLDHLSTPAFIVPLICLVVIYLAIPVPIAPFLPP